MVSPHQSNGPQRVLHLRCPDESMFDSTGPHCKFNYKMEVIFHHDLAKFSENEIHDICPGGLEGGGKYNMIVLIFFCFTSRDYIHIRSLSLLVKTFIE